MARPSLVLVLVLVSLSFFSTSCIDPTHDNAVDALGPEVAGIPRGPLHRAGQPCLVCHSGSGPGSPELSVAGTIFIREGETAPAIGAVVVLRDLRGDVRRVTTNEVGTFLIERTDWDPAFPLRAEIERGSTPLVMRTEIPRDGSCNACHRGTGDTYHMPGVYLEAAP